MTLKEYKQKLDKHDWFYMMSDDPRWYDSGLAAETELEKLAEKDKELREAFDAKKNELFGQPKTHYHEQETTASIGCTQEN